MAFTQTQIISDTYNRHVLKRVNSGNTESNAVLINVATVAYGLSTMTLTAGSNVFKVGETITNGAGASAVVQQVVNAIAINVINVANGTFGNGNTITGSTTTRTRTQSGALASVTKKMSVSKFIYNVFGPVEAKLQIDWEGDGATNLRTIAVLSGAGEFCLDKMGASANNNAPNATGNVLLTTTGWNTNSHYTLVAEFNKTEGFAMPYLEQNIHLGF